MSARPVQLARAGAVAGAILLSIALVAVASRSDRPEGAGGVSDVERLGTLVDSVFTILLVLYAFLIAFLVWVLWPDRERKGKPLPVTTLSLPAFLFFVFVISAIVYFGRAEPLTPPPEVQPALNPVGGTLSQGVQTPGEDDRALSFQWPLALALVLAIAGAVAIVLYADRRRRSRVAVSARLEDDLAAVIEATLADVRGERDPRRAVIAAYAQMEHVLAAHGLPRVKSEAPFEYLARVLRRLDVSPAAALALTELFERARFSQHDVDEAMRDEAIGALDAVRDDLRAA